VTGKDSLPMSISEDFGLYLNECFSDLYKHKEIHHSYTLRTKVPHYRFSDRGRKRGSFLKLVEDRG